MENQITFKVEYHLGDLVSVNLPGTFADINAEWKVIGIMINIGNIIEYVVARHDLHDKTRTVTLPKELLKKYEK